MEGEVFVAKVLVVGDPNVGKTSLVKRYVHGAFSQHYKSTIGVDFALKSEPVGNDEVQMQMWDIGGQERFTNMTRVYYRDAHAVIIMFDLSMLATFHACAKWKEDLERKLEHPIYTVLVGNKRDIAREKTIPKNTELTEFCNSTGIDAYFETSARTGLGIEDVCHAVAVNVLRNAQPLKEGSGDNITLEVEQDFSRSCCYK